MSLLQKCLFTFFTLSLGLFSHLTAEPIRPHTIPTYPRDETIYNQYYYTQPTPTYPVPAPYEYYTSPPPPTSNQAFPDDAQQNSLYRELQSR